MYCRVRVSTELTRTGCITARDSRSYVTHLPPGCTTITRASATCMRFRVGLGVSLNMDERWGLGSGANHALPSAS